MRRSRTACCVINSADACVARSSACTSACDPCASTALEIDVFLPQPCNGVACFLLEAVLAREILFCRRDVGAQIMSPLARAVLLGIEMVSLVGQLLQSGREFRFLLPQCRQPAGTVALRRRCPFRGGAERGHPFACRFQCRQSVNLRFLRSAPAQEEKQRLGPENRSRRDFGSASPGAPAAASPATGPRPRQ